MERVATKLFSTSQGAEFLEKLSEHLYGLYGLEHHPTVMRNRQDGYMQKCGDGKYQMVMGWQALACASTNGFLEYESYRWLWDGKMTGYRAVWALAVHEVAHAVQMENGELRRGSVHNDSWARRVLELKNLAPFDEMAAVFGLLV